MKIDESTLGLRAKWLTEIVPFHVFPQQSLDWLTHRRTMICYFNILKDLELISLQYWQYNFSYWLEDKSQAKWTSVQL